MPVRPFIETDVPTVADLYWHHMRGMKSPVPLAIQGRIRELYVLNPWVDRSFPPLVYENSGGKVVGFAGAFVRKMSFRGKPLKVTFGGGLIVHKDARSSPAGPRLVSTFMNGKHELQMTDSANERARKFEERYGGHVIPALNLHWSRPLRPAQYAAYMALRPTGPVLFPILRTAAKPFCMLADRVARKLASSLFPATSSKLQGADLDAQTLLGCVIECRKDYALWPEYELSSLEWLLDFMGRSRAHGTLRKTVVRDENQKILGWYIYYAKRGGIGEVVQVGGDRTSIKQVLDHLFQDAFDQGAIALHGVVDLRHMADFSDKGCVFTCRGGWTLALSKDEHIMSALRRGDAFLSRLDGEWCLDAGV
jgi:hypothetical protein